MTEDTKKVMDQDEELSSEQLEEVAGGASIDQLRRENLEKDAVDTDTERRSNLDKD